MKNLVSPATVPPNGNNYESQNQEPGYNTNLYEKENRQNSENTYGEFHFAIEKGMLTIRTEQKYLYIDWKIQQDFKKLKIFTYPRLFFKAPNQTRRRNRKTTKKNIKPLRQILINSLSLTHRAFVLKYLTNRVRQLYYLSHFRTRSV